MEKLDREFLAWLAGFWEGEGWITARYRSGNSSYSKAAIGIKQKDRSPLDLIRTKLNVGSISLERTGKYSIWKWGVTNRSKVIEIIRCLLPYLKFRDIETAKKLEFLVEREAKNPTIGKRQKNYSEDEINYILTNWAKPDIEIAKKLNRSIASLRHKRQRLGLIKSRGWNARWLSRDPKGRFKGMPKNIEVGRFTIDNEGTKVEWKV